MSIAHEQRISELEKKMAEYAGMSTIEFRKHLAELEMRVERLESAHLILQEQLSKAYDIIAEHRKWIADRKPGPKPKEKV